AAPAPRARRCRTDRAARSGCASARTLRARGRGSSVSGSTSRTASSTRRLPGSATILARSAASELGPERRGPRRVVAVRRRREELAQSRQRAVKRNLDRIGLQAEQLADLPCRQIGAVAKGNQLALAFVEAPHDAADLESAQRGLFMRLDRELRN